MSMKRIICHWTGGGYKATALDKKHYHFIFEDDGKMVEGIHSVSANENTKDGVYAAHTFHCNEGSIGTSLCCMAGAIENPYKPGKSPMTKTQWDAQARYVAKLCRAYKIAVTPDTVLSHAEVQPNLGIKQKGKWDYTRLPWDPSIKGHKACGDRLRADVLAAMAPKKPAETPKPSAPAAPAPRPTSAAAPSTPPKPSSPPAPAPVNPVAPVAVAAGLAATIIAYVQTNPLILAAGVVAVIAGVGLFFYIKRKDT
jgi:hypothetical protein